MSDTVTPARRDFPFYNGHPVAISLPGWLVIIASVVLALAVLITLPFADFPLNLVPAIAFTTLPLLALAAVSGGRQDALFGPFGLRELALALGFGVLTLVISVIVGLVLSRFISMTANATAAQLVDITGFDLAVFLIRTFIQLIGEELLTILPLMAVLWLCVEKLGLSRRAGLVAAVAVSTLWFAAVHLPTYDWNLIQCLGGIGAARLVLTAAYLVTRNLWVSAGAHIVNDWSEFFLPVLLDDLSSHGPIDTAG